MAVLIFHSQDGNSIAEFVYDMEVRSDYKIKNEYIDRDKTGWSYHVQILSDYPYVRHLHPKNKASFTPDGLLSWDAGGGREIFINPKTGMPEYVRY